MVSSEPLAAPPSSLDASSSPFASSAGSGSPAAPSRRRVRTAPPLPLEEVADRLAKAVEQSPADETEVVWIETLEGAAAVPARVAAPHLPPTANTGGPPQRRGSVQVRVRERGRVGFHRTGPGRAGDPAAAGTVAGLAAAVRQALGQARLGPPAPPLPLAGTGGGPRDLPTLHDPALAALTPEAAADLLAAGRGDDDHLRIEWHELRLVIANSRGLVRAVEATAATLHARHGRGPGAGRAAGSARTLAALAAPRVVARAAERAAPEAIRSPGKGGDAVERIDAVQRLPILLAPEAAATLVRAFADHGLGSRAFLDGGSWLADRLGETVVHSALSLTDDGLDPDGLPFPFDADGWPKRRVALVEAGVLASPAVDAALGQALGRTPTPHAVAFDESRPGNLLLATGEASPEDLLEAAEGGLWIGALEALRCSDPRSGELRAVARGVRRVENGRPGAPVEDLTWSSHLGEALAEVLALGRDSEVLAAHGAWGGVRAPSLVLVADGWTPRS